MRDTFWKQMNEELAAFHLQLTEEQLKKFYRYFELLEEKNKVMNLTAITEEREVVTKHFVDSLSLVRVFPELEGGREFSIIDVGTGAGFPGIPLKIVYPNLQVTLLDSLKKRVCFLQEVCSQLELENISAVHGRAEDFGRDKNFREAFDLCVSRAVANLATLSEYCLPFVRIGGLFISYKSEEVGEEIKGAESAIKQLGGKIKSIQSFKLPKTDMGRSLIAIEKMKKLSGKYPRKAGLPSKEPLG